MVETMLETRNLSVSFGEKQALHDVSLTIPARGVMALIGPSGCGKTTFLRALNRMHDETPTARVSGQVLLNGENVYAEGYDAVALRRRIGMVFQKPNPFPQSIFQNVAFAIQRHGLAKGKMALMRRVRSALERAGLLDEVSTRLRDPALSLSGGQQQRLCIARAIAIDPEVLLMDEPCSALDPVATEKIEQLILSLAKEMCVVIVTHNLAQARRIASHMAYFHMGRCLSSGPAAELLSRPTVTELKNYISGRLG